MESAFSDTLQTTHRPTVELSGGAGDFAAKKIKMY
jgi:hypothetical protein